MSPNFNRLIFRVDFNATEGERIVARRASGPPIQLHPDIGDLVLMTDDEGNQCEGVVREVSQRTLLIEPLLWTWTHETRMEFSGIGGGAAGTMDAAPLGETHTFELVG